MSAMLDTGRVWIPTGAAYPAVPRILPASPDDRWQGQGAVVTARPQLEIQRALEIAIPGPGMVAILPLDPASTSGLSVGVARVQALPPGGGSWERNVDVPPWGCVLAVPGGLTTVDVALNQADALAWSITSAPAVPTLAAIPPEPIDSVAPAATFNFTPPAFAVKARLYVFEGELAFGTTTSPGIKAPGVIEAPARRYQITGIGAGSNRFSLQWEVFA